MKRLTAAEYRAMAAESAQKGVDSFERCDTDGFLSQWSHDLHNQLYHRLAQLAEDGWVSTFPGLYRVKDGARIKAKLISTRFGACWAVLDERGAITEFIPAGGGRKAKKLGLEVRDEQAPAYATFAGKRTVYVNTFRTDGGYPSGAVVIGGEESMDVERPGSVMNGLLKATTGRTA